MSRTFSIGKADQQITVEALADRKFGDADFTVNATASSNLVVCLTASGNCSLTGNQVHLDWRRFMHHNRIAGWRCEYQCRGSRVTDFSIGKADQQNTVEALADRKVGDADFSVNATTSSNLAVSLAASGNCSVNRQSGPSDRRRLLHYHRLARRQRRLQPGRRGLADLRHS